jgi:putative transposase
MAQKAVAAARCSVHQACLTFNVSESCYRYRARLSSENAEIADLMVRLTHNQRNWGFGLCFLYLHNVKGYPWNHRRVYRICRELELNLRIKPRKRVVHEKLPTTGGTRGRKHQLIYELRARSVKRTVAANVCSM